MPAPLQPFLCDAIFFDTDATCPLASEFSDLTFPTSTSASSSQSNPVFILFFRCCPCFCTIHQGRPHLCCEYLEMVPPVNKKRNTVAEVDGLCQPRHESHRNKTRGNPLQNRLEENCVCRSDLATKWERLEEEEEEEEGLLSEAPKSEL